MNVEGRSRQGKPRRRSMDCVQEDLAQKQLRKRDAGDRQRLKAMARKSDS